MPRLIWRASSGKAHVATGASPVQASAKRGAPFSVSSFQEAIVSTHCHCTKRQFSQLIVIPRSDSDEEPAFRVQHPNASKQHIPRFARIKTTPDPTG